ncbi:hypothetical protein, partial [Pseudomonas sp. GD03691]|uniref:hypothetical protein n=1 Tax=Pseudomonas sp. GD03691 TaxID=2975367 RepID=UPI00244CBD38
MKRPEATVGIAEVSSSRHCRHNAHTVSRQCHLPERKAISLKPYQAVNDHSGITAMDFNSQASISLLPAGAGLMVRRGCRC